VTEDRIVSCLPLCEITERALVGVHATRAACTVHFGEGGAALEQDVREVQPTIFLGVPRLWSRLRARAESGLRDAGKLKRTAFRVALRRGRSTAPQRLEGARVADPLARALAGIVMRPLRRQLGLGHVRIALAGGAPSTMEELAWWWAIGVPVREVYGLTESSGMATVMPADDVRLGTVGRAIAGVELRVEPGAHGRGEIRIRGDVVFAGYLDGGADPDSARLVDGWLHTGDVGELDDDGYLTIVDRLRDVIITSAGHDVAPAPITRALEASPYVEHALVVGDGRPHVGALLAIAAAAVSEWASARGVPFTTYQSLAESPDVHDLIAAEIDAVNEHLADPDRVRSFALLRDELTHDGGVLTAIGKVRRRALETILGDVVEAMYASTDDGRRA
jgi:long-chain acyl-CoA synthetase